MDGGGGPQGDLDLHQFLTAFADPRFEPMIRHWLSLRQTDPIPRRGSIDPTQFHSSLDMVWLLERHADGHYRYRLAGQAISEIHGGIRRDTDTSTLFRPEALAMFRSRWEAVLDHGMLVRAEGMVVLAGGDQLSRVERLMLPLRADDGAVSVILGATHYERPRAPGLITTDFPLTSIQRCPLVRLPLGV